MDDVLDLSLAELLEVIRALQERRANAFFRFDEALRESLNALKENPHNLRDSQLGYEAVVKKVTVRWWWQGRKLLSGGQAGERIVPLSKLLVPRIVIVFLSFWVAFLCAFVLYVHTHTFF